MASAEHVAYDQRTTTPSLRSGSIGTVGMIFMVVAAAAPLTALASNIAIAIAAGSGTGTVGLFVVVAAVLAVFSVGYLRLARYVRSAGGQSAFVSFGMGKPAGSAVAMANAVGLNAGSAAMAVAAGLFLSVTIEQFGGTAIPWYVGTLLVFLMLAAMARRGVQTAEKVTVVCSVLQFLFVGVLAVAVLVQHPDGWTLSPFDPGVTFSGNVAVGIVFVIFCFAGFESSTIYSEESRGGHRSVVTATYLSLVLLTVIFVVSTWTLVAGTPDVVSVATTDPTALVPAIVARYLGEWAAGMVLLLVVVSFAGAAVAFHNMAVRYQFALARAQLLPAALMRTSGARRSPHVSALCQVGFSLVLVTPFVIGGVDVFRTLLPSIGGITSVCILLVMISASVSVIVARARDKIDGGVWATRIAPGVAALLLAATAVLVAFNYAAVTGSDSPYIVLLPLIPIAALLYGGIRQARLPDSPGVEGPTTTTTSTTAG
ncbi:APC family permease [Pseudonocardia sp. MH-G8]|uniref:APC family permease n=1 Tax=Pseudonocardia sp. MH-G8 TaxID=1854588 RepID=UPI000BA18F99|nr:APC family permease [Pseudonocardia sp. MH-G8]OZM78895.1 amino acid permease [Pseudonocardia sp. MH-G8]